MNSATFRILVGIDFSESSAGALYHALALAERLNAELHLCHVAPSNADLNAPTDLGLNVPSEFKDAQEARQRLERMRAMIGAKINVELHLRMGEPVHGILELVREVKPDMLVVGSHGSGAVKRLFLGSVSTELTRKCPVPVLVVPAPGRELSDRVTLPADVKVEPPLPSVGNSTPDKLDVNRTNDAASGSVNVSPAGVGGYDVNPELRVRY
jgi:nucleotide-binding universal stress UspA family protein